MSPPPPIIVLATPLVPTTPDIDSFYTANIYTKVSVELLSTLPPLPFPTLNSQRGSRGNLTCHNIFVK
jgi:hypothetical protein